MSKALTKKEVQDRFLSDSAKVSKIQRILSDPDFEEYLQVVSTYMHPYCAEAQPSPVPHIEMERVGAIFGANKFGHLIKNVAYYQKNGRDNAGEDEFRKPDIK